MKYKKNNYFIQYFNKLHEKNKETGWHGGMMDCFLRPNTTRFFGLCQPGLVFWRAKPRAKMGGLTYWTHLYTRDHPTIYNLPSPLPFLEETTIPYVTSLSSSISHFLEVTISNVIALETITPNVILPSPISHLLEATILDITYLRSPHHLPSYHHLHVFP